MELLIRRAQQKQAGRKGGHEPGEESLGKWGSGLSLFTSWLVMVADFQWFMAGNL